MRSVGFRSLLLAGALILCHGVSGFVPLDTGKASVGHSEHVVAGYGSEKTDSEGSVGSGCLATLAVLLLGSVVLAFRWMPSGDRSRLLVFRRWCATVMEPIQHRSFGGARLGVFRL
jgi:hypothetical protein